MVGEEEEKRGKGSDGEETEGKLEQSFPLVGWGKGSIDKVLAT